MNTEDSNTTDVEIIMQTLLKYQYDLSDGFQYYAGNMENKRTTVDAKLTQIAKEILAKLKK